MNRQPSSVRSTESSALRTPDNGGEPRSRRARRVSAACVAPMALSAFSALAGCTNEPLSVGRNDVALETPACGDGVVEGGVNAREQEDLDALSGCEEILGDLRITKAEGEAELDLAPLAALRIVRGGLRLIGLGSLDGLEAVEEVGGLELSNLTVPDLTPLRGLARVVVDPLTFEPESDTGGAVARSSVSLSGCNALEDLRGLENLRTWGDLYVGENERLVSLDGLGAPPRAGQIQVALSPNFKDASALGPIVELEILNFFQTGVETLGDLQLRTANAIVFDGNPALTDLGGLARLSSLETMVINDNDSLRSVDLPSLEEVHLISITGNAVLETVPAYDARLGRGFFSGLGGANAISFTHFVYDIGDNPLLSRIVMPVGYSQVQQVTIWQNPSLTELDLNDLSRADGLLIRDNAALASVRLPLLERVGDLGLVNNPSLSAAPFDAVQTFTRDVSGNLDAAAP